MIEVIEITNDLIHLEDNTTVDRAKFEKWIDENDKRDWGANTGETGIMTWEQYYDSKYLINDLAEYVNTRSGKLKNMYDLGTGLKKLLKS